MASRNRTSNSRGRTNYAPALGRKRIYAVHVRPETPGEWFRSYANAKTSWICLCHVLHEYATSSPPLRPNTRQAGFFFSECIHHRRPAIKKLIYGSLPISLRPRRIGLRLLRQMDIPARTRSSGVTIKASFRREGRTNEASLLESVIRETVERGTLGRTGKHDRMTPMRVPNLTLLPFRVMSRERVPCDASLRDAFDSLSAT